MNSPIGLSPKLPNTVKFTILAMAITWVASNSVTAQPFDTPQSRMRPLGSPSRVDRDRRPYSHENTRKEVMPRGTFLRETAHHRSGFLNGSVRQTAMQFELPGNVGPLQPAPLSPSLPPGPVPSSPQTRPPALRPGPRSPDLGAAPNPGLPSRFPSAPMAMQPATSQPATSQTLTPQGMPPTGQAFNPQRQGLPARGFYRTNDLTPLTQPTLGNEFATVNNCTNVTGPSGYSAAMGSCCAPVNYQGVRVPQAYAAPPAQIPSPALLPPFLGNGPISQGPAPSPVGPPATAGPASALITFGQQFNPVQVGPGLLGQPKAYVPGQYFRNWLRYFTP